MNTKHCVQLKQATLQIPWAGSCSSSNAENNTHSKNTAQKYTFANLVLGCFLQSVITVSVPKTEIYGQGRP
jgi:hypothetical protein